MYCLPTRPRAIRCAGAAAGCGPAGVLVAMAIGLAGCAPQPSRPPVQRGEQAPATLEQRLQALSEKYAITERTSRDPEQIRQHIARLEEERQALLKRYTEAHPSVIQIDRQIRLLHEQLQSAGSGEPGN